jgi:hypothetical protein
MLKYLYNNYITIKVDLINKNNTTFEPFINSTLIDKNIKLKSIRLIQIVSYSKAFNNSKLIFSEDFKDEKIISIDNFFRIKKNCNIYIPQKDFFLYFLDGKTFNDLKNISFKFEILEEKDVDVVIEFLITYEKKD